MECLGTALINNPKGGAVGYIGHSRLCDLGYAQPMQERFFTALPKAFHLGALNDSRVVVQYTANKKAVSTLNLLGDPEMPVWIGRPDTLDVTHPARVGFGAQTFNVTVNSGGKPVEGAFVCLMLDGNTTTGSTDASGKAALAIAPATRGQIEVLVTHRNAIPYMSKVQVGRFLEVTVRPTLVQPGAANPVSVTVNVQEEGTPVLNANIVLSSPLSWTAQYVTGSDGRVSFQINPAVMCERHVPIRLEPDPSGSILQIYGGIGVEASKSGYEPDYATILMGISLPELVWWRPPLQSLENWLAWPDRLIEQFPEKWRTDPATRETIANTFLALDVLSQVNVMLAKGSDLLTVSTILGLSDGKEYNRQAVLQRLDALSTLVSENLNRLNEKLPPIRLIDKEVTPPEVETLVGV